MHSACTTGTAKTRASSSSDVGGGASTRASGRRRRELVRPRQQRAEHRRAVVARWPTTRSIAGAAPASGRLVTDRGIRSSTQARINASARVAAIIDVVPTDMSSFAKTEAGRAFTLGIQAFKRLAAPDDIADAIVFLASDASRWTSGHTLAVDGGSKL